MDGSSLTSVVALTALAGAAIPIGGAVAAVERIQPRWLEAEFRHSVVAFGGGVLLAAVALVLVPHGMQDMSLAPALAVMFAGGVAFLMFDVAVNRMKASAAQLLAMLSDFVPEALALGAAFARGDRVGLLLALLIALQNLPEGFNAFREIKSSGRIGTKTVLLGFALLVPLGPLSGLIGYYWLAPRPAAVGGVMLFAAGGILYATFQDIAPQAVLRRHWGPPLAAVIGFEVGMLGTVLT